MLDFQKRLLYDLKRQYGQPLALYIQQVSNPDLRTGQRNTVQTVYAFQQAIVVAPKFFSQGIYSASFLKAGREFAHGAFQTQDIKIIIIDGNDLPIGFEVTPDQHVVLKSKRYEVFNVEELEDSLGYIITVKRLVGVQTEEIHTSSINQKFRMTQSVNVNYVHNLTVTQTFTFTEGIT
jgi:hypothetical protein